MYRQKAKTLVEFTTKFYVTLVGNKLKLLSFTALNI